MYPTNSVFNLFPDPAPFSNHVDPAFLDLLQILMRCAPRYRPVHARLTSKLLNKKGFCGFGSVCYKYNMYQHRACGCQSLYCECAGLLLSERSMLTEVINSRLTRHARLTSICRPRTSNALARDCNRYHSTRWYPPKVQILSTDQY